MENIMENNKLIAEFMGYEIQKDPTERFFGRYKSPIGVWHKEIDLSFHHDWNWLMEVINKITTTEEFKDEYEFNQLFWETFNQLDIDEIYTQVISFIKWYNENK